MSLRWIYENCEPPVVDEECSDIDDSCSDDSYDSDLMPAAIAESDNCNAYDNYSSPVNGFTDVTDNGKIHRDPEKRSIQCIPSDHQLMTNNLAAYQSLKLKLFCRTGHYVGITSTGRVKGFTADNSNDAQVRFILSPVTCRVIRLQNIETGRYLAFNSTGHLYGESKASKDNTEWEQWNTGKYDSFRSHKYADAGWWLAIKNNGRHKPGPKTSWAQKAIQFVIIRMA